MSLTKHLVGGSITVHTIVGVNVAHKTLGRVNERSHDSWLQCRTQNINDRSHDSWRQCRTQNIKGWGLMTSHTIVGVNVEHKTWGG